jgi:hypothetical protein
MYSKRFPPEVTDHHLNGRIRFLTREINRIEGATVRSALNLIGSAGKVLNDVSSGNGTGDRASVLVVGASAIVAALSRREALYEMLAEEAGDADEYANFCNRYPPTYLVEERLGI